MSFRLAYLASTPDAAPFALGWNGELKHIVTRLAAIGYDGLELHVREPKLVDAPALAKLIGGAGLSMSGFGSAPISLLDKLHLIDADPDVRRRAIARFKELLELASAFGVDASIGRFRGMLKSAPSREDGIAWFRAALEECLPVAERLGVRIVLEPMNRGTIDFLTTVDETIAFIGTFGSGALTFEADLFHLAAEERSLIASLVRAQRSGRMSYVQVSDTQRRAPGLGTFNWAGIMQTLQTAGYGGWIAVECQQQPDSEQCAVQAHATLSPIIAARHLRPKENRLGVRAGCL
jgi:sugar phosphate isomerase/epimerase